MRPKLTIKTIIKFCRTTHTPKPSLPTGFIRLGGLTPFYDVWQHGDFLLIVSTLVLSRLNDAI